MNDLIIDWKSGDLALLEENDAFGTRTHMRILKIHRGGNARVMDLSENAADQPTRKERTNL